MKNPLLNTYLNGKKFLLIKKNAATTWIKSINYTKVPVLAGIITRFQSIDWHKKRFPKFNLSKPWAIGLVGILGAAAILSSIFVFYLISSDNNDQFAQKTPSKNKNRVDKPQKDNKESTETTSAPTPPEPVETPQASAQTQATQNRQNESNNNFTSRTEPQAPTNNQPVNNQPVPHITTPQIINEPETVPSGPVTIDEPQNNVVISPPDAPSMEDIHSPTDGPKGDTDPIPVPLPEPESTNESPQPSPQPTPAPDQEPQPVPVPEPDPNLLETPIQIPQP